MRHFLLLLGFSLFAVIADAQSILLQENFNDCGNLPTGWSVFSPGNPNAVWYVGTPLNNDSDSLSMDGSCCFIIDDDATGDMTPAYKLFLISPEFDCSKHGTIEVSMDVHYRDWNDAPENFQVLATDGTNTWQIALFDENNQTGEQFHEYVTLKFDLALLTNSPNVQLMFVYDDADGFAWWAGVDNVEVRGFETGSNVLVETFNDCILPQTWETQILEGEDDWFFGYADNGNAYPNSMNGSCFAFFDDDVLGAQDTTPSSRGRLKSPWFDGTQFAEYTLYLDLIQRDWREGQLTLLIEHGDGTEHEAKIWADDIGGPQFDEYLPQTVDISAFRDKQMRLIFEFWDGNEWGWWTGFDNLKVSAKGDANDLCARALPLLTGPNCKPGDNRTAVFDGPLPACADKSDASLWYSWQADFTGTARLTSAADFNDVLTVFAGGCAAPTAVYCNNRDEYGFTGESSFFPVEQGQNYLLRLSGVEGNFGAARGSFCVKVEQTGAPNPPGNDNCQNAQTITLDALCNNGNNRNATTSIEIHTLAQRARADVWYRFVAPVLNAGEKISFRTNADFSDVITLYSGACNNLAEVAGNPYGQKLDVAGLNAGQTYRVQVSGNLATVEGSICAELRKTGENPPANDDCFSAQSIVVNGNCTSGNNLDAGFSGHQPPCVVKVEKDIWFKFVAPGGGSVRVNTGADFEHVLAVWEGNCTDLTAVFCVENPLRCQGFVQVPGLVAGRTYYLQIASLDSPSGFSAGEICLKIAPGSGPADFLPLRLEVLEHCTGIGTAELLIAVKDGVQPYAFSGASGGQNLNSGDYYTVIVTDAIGCVQSLTDLVNECTESACAMNVSLTIEAQAGCDGNSGALTVNTIGGTAPLNFDWSIPGVSGNAPTGLAAGIYTVTVTDSEGCETSATAQLVNFPPIGFSAAVENESNGLANGSIDLVPVSGNSDYGFQWNFSGAPFSNAQDLSNLSSGTYSVTVTDNTTGCTKTETFVLSNIVGSINPEIDFYAELSPNPAAGQTVLSVKLTQAETMKISLLDISGRLLQEWQLGKAAAQNLLIDLSEKAPGNYSVKISTETGEQTLKLVVGQ